MYQQKCSRCGYQWRLNIKNPKTQQGTQNLPKLSAYKEPKDCPSCGSYYWHIPIAGYHRKPKKCPNCQKLLEIREGRHGKFWECTGFRYTKLTRLCLS